MALLEGRVTDLRQLMMFRNERVEKISRETKKGNGTIFASDKYVQAFARARTYTLDSYNWSEEFSHEFNNNTVKSRNIPKIILTEFQPRRSFNFDASTQAIAGGVLTAGKAIRDAAKPASGDGFLTKIVKGVASPLLTQVGSGGVTALERFVYEYYAIPGNRSAVDGVAMDFVKNLMDGQYLNVYEIPYFGDDYLHADTTKQWSSSGSEVMLGKEAMEILKNDFNINFPMSPQWKKSSDTTKLNWSTKFHLINDTTTNLERNFKFLNSLIAGNYWMQLGFTQKSPNVFDCHCPGRFHQYFTALNVKVEYKGKTRANRAFSQKLQEMKLEGFTGEDVLFPDAYEIEIKCTDLTPNNFNVYMEHMLGHEKVVVGNTVSRFGSPGYLVDKGIKSAELAKAIATGDTKALDALFGRTTNGNNSSNNSGGGVRGGN